MLPHPEDVKTHRPTWVPETAWLHPSYPSAGGLPPVPPQLGWPRLHGESFDPFPRGVPRGPQETMQTGNEGEEGPEQEGRKRQDERVAWQGLGNPRQSNHTPLLEPAPVQLPSECGRLCPHSKELRDRGQRKQLALCRFDLPGRGPRVPVDSKNRRKY